MVGIVRKMLFVDLFVLLFLVMDFDFDEALFELLDGRMWLLLLLFSCFGG